MKLHEKYPHYYKCVQGLTHIDVYRVLDLFEVKDPCLQHAVKKLLCAGSRGNKDIQKDVLEANASLERWLEMRREEGSVSPYQSPVSEKIEALMPHVRRHLPFNYLAMVDGKPMITMDGRSAKFDRTRDILGGRFFVDVAGRSKEYEISDNGKYWDRVDEQGAYIKELQLFMVEE